MSTNRRYILAAAIGILSAGVVPAQDQAIPKSGFNVSLGADSPLSMVSMSTENSRATALGAGLVLNLDMSLTLRNTNPQRINGVSLRVVAQEVTLGGKASVTLPSLNIAPGETFPVRIKMQLMRPSQVAGGPLVQVDLDGVLFQNLSFFGPDRLNSRRTMLAYETEARRDREHFKRVLAQAGREGLQREMLESLNRQAETNGLTVAVSRSGRSTTALANPEHKEEFAFLKFPDSPVEPLTGSAQIAGNEARAPRIEVRNTSSRPVKYVEMGWIVSDPSGRMYMAGSLPSADHDMTLSPGHSTPLLQQTTLNFTVKGKPVEVRHMTGFVSQVEFTDGKVWVPNRENLDNTTLLKVLPPSAEEQRLSDIYRRRGIDALLTELNRY